MISAVGERHPGASSDHATVTYAQLDLPPARIPSSLHRNGISNTDYIAEIQSQTA